MKMTLNRKKWDFFHKKSFENLNDVTILILQIEADPRQKVTAKYTTISVTRWLDYMANIWPFPTMKICQRRFKFLPNIK